MPWVWLAAFDRYTLIDEPECFGVVERFYCKTHDTNTCLKCPKCGKEYHDNSLTVRSRV